MTTARTGTEVPDELQDLLQAVTDPEPWSGSAAHERSAARPSAVEAAFTVVFVEHRQACLRLARRLVREEGLAHEVVQEVFLAWWRSDGGGYRAEQGELGHWLQTVTHHKSVDAVRASERQRRLHAAAVSASARAPEERLVDEVVWWKLGAQSLSAAWPTLSQHQQEVLGLAYVTGLTQSQIAERLGIPVGTVKSRTRAGMHRLRTTVGASWTPTGPTSPDAGPSTSGADDPPRVWGQRRPGSTVAVAAVPDLVEDCAATLVRLARDADGSSTARAEMAARTAALVEEHGEAGMHALVTSLAHLAARGALPPTSAARRSTGC